MVANPKITARAAPSAAQNQCCVRALFTKLMVVLFILFFLALYFYDPCYLERMSGWDAYITSITSGSPAIKRAAIVGLNDGAVWARTEGANVFSATDAELKKFVAHFNNLNSVPGTGADLENVHYIVPRTEENLIFGKKDKSGFFAAKTKTAVLIAVYEGENTVSADVRSAIEKLAVYMEGLGY